MRGFFSLLLMLVSFSSFASPRVDKFKVDFNIWNISPVVISAFASYDSLTQYDDFHPCRRVSYDRELKVTQVGTGSSVKGEIPLISKSGDCKAPFKAIVVLIKNEKGSEQTIYFIAGDRGVLAPEEVSVNCLDGSVRTKVGGVTQDVGVWSASYIDFVCSSPQSKAATQNVFSFDPMKPFNLKEISLTYFKETAPDFSTVLATEKFSSLQFLFSQNNWGSVGANSPVKVLGFPEFEGLNFIVTIVSFAKNKLSPFIAVKNLNQKGPYFEIDEVDKFDDCKSKRLMRVWLTGGGVPKVVCLD